MRPKIDLTRAFATANSYAEEFEKSVFRTEEGTRINEVSVALLLTLESNRQLMSSFGIFRQLALDEMKLARKALTSPPPSPRDDGWVIEQLETLKRLDTFIEKYSKKEAPPPRSPFTP